MSGKSTFLRTVGVNVLLARCGAPVCAGSFSCSPMAIYSSLRQSDSLQDHVSTFYAELRKLQAILQGLEANPHALVLLDEVLRGTNSDDKLYGSQQLVKRLIDNESLAAQGNFKWDGTTDDGTKARIGIYVVWTELFSPAGRIEQNKSTCVLAGKLD